MFLVNSDFEHTFLKWRYASGVYKCKSCEIGNHMFFNVMFSFSKTDEQVIT